MASPQRNTSSEGRSRTTMTSRQQLTVRTAIYIAAAPEQVWKVLIDLAGYRQWHPSMELLGRSDGDDQPLREGSVLRLRTNRGTALELDFEVTVTEVLEGSTLAWQGGDPEVFFGRHTWTLTSEGEGTRVVNEETFTGAMAEAVFAEHRHTLETQYAAGDAALKSAAENPGT
ncbi:SRPBCC domain-containing protein [Actinacidiphila oryziradicis]|uniref:SRPBCC domain-containing protein n=2 Tax=Actinacidiphila oryziradicis TaxID=2571141 RepID=A0A4U0SEX1_9ACTN|nr:SRPBCC domain-containing protein [Actinacidiphila oryziradicis]